MKALFGLLGRDISYSFSRSYFTEKFKKLNLEEYEYRNFDIPHIDQLPYILNEHMAELKGFNVTIPYKEEVFKYLDEVNEDAAKVGAVNCVKILDDYRLKGFNTDVYGFQESIKPLLKPYHDKALVLGSGGASKAVCFSLEKLKIEYVVVSRKPSKEKGQITYDDLKNAYIKDHYLIINTTPLGTFPDTGLQPDLPYDQLTDKHLLYDLIYNPPETSFLKWGRLQGAQTKNGLEMLQLQAEKSWALWNL